MTVTLPQRSVGRSPERFDARAKVTGSFAFSSDLTADDALCAATVRSPHANALIRSLDTSRAKRMAGVRAVLSAADVPGHNCCGPEHSDQPVFAEQEVIYWGQPIAVVAADTLQLARQAAAAVDVDYTVLDGITDPERADRLGYVFRRVNFESGDDCARGPVVVENYYEVGTQDQAPLGTESGIAIPDGVGGVDLYANTQWLHVDHEQITAALGLRQKELRVHPVGVGGAFGAREDLTLHVHLCMLALVTGRPVRMIYDREESFVGHVHRHPARMWYRHEADTVGRLVRVDVRILIDGGAYASTSPSVLGNIASFAVGPYKCPTVRIQGAAARTNNPPCGAMRGFGAPQACFAYEAQMDQLAEQLGLDPIELRLRNALQTGDRLPTTGQLITSPLPVREIIGTLRDMPLDDRARSDARELPGGTGLTTSPSHVRRGVGIAVGIKSIGYAEGFDDYAEARVIVDAAGATVQTAAVEVGQGIGQALKQLVSDALGIANVTVNYVDTSSIGSAGSSSASRQTMLSGGAAVQAATAVRSQLLETYEADELDDDGLWRNGELLGSLSDLLGDRSFQHLARFRHPRTEAPDERGHGQLHADYAIACHRAVVDVDPELGLIRVIAIDTVQDVGRAINPIAVLGQIEGGIAQGVGLAALEELVVERGRILNPSFTDYLLPTIIDAPAVTAELIEEPSPWGPFGAKGVGEAPTVSSTAAIAAAVRNATGVHVGRVPMRPYDIASVHR